jgi:hypothetical protein
MDRPRDGVPIVCLTTNGPTLDIENRPVNIGRDDWIRTSDPLTPSQVRYQAALHPVFGWRAVSGRYRRFLLGAGLTFFAARGLGASSTFN